MQNDKKSPIHSKVHNKIQTNKSIERVKDKQQDTNIPKTKKKTIMKWNLFDLYQIII
jgi:hypothetical protein